MTLALRANTSDHPNIIEFDAHMHCLDLAWTPVNVRAASTIKTINRDLILHLAAIAHWANASLHEAQTSS
jgi:hypothetical protein